MDARQKKNPHYISNKEFYKEICKCQKEDVCSDKLAQYFITLSVKIANKTNFSGYTFKDEFISESIEACIKAWKKFDPNKSENPFSYFTTVIQNKIINIIKKFKKNYQREQAYKENIYIELLQKNNLYVDMKKIADMKGRDYYSSDEPKDQIEDKNEVLEELETEVSTIKQTLNIIDETNEEINSKKILDFGIEFVEDLVDKEIKEKPSFDNPYKGVKNYETKDDDV